MSKEIVEDLSGDYLVKKSGNSMQFFKNILLYYNEEFGGIKTEVIRLIRKNQAKLKIIDVFDNFNQYLELMPPSSSVDELKEVIISERRKEIIHHFDEEPDISNQVNLIFRFGNPVVEIIKEAVLGKHDLVIKAASGLKFFKERLFGDVAVKLLRKCPCPVLIIKPSGTFPIKKILAPIDPVAELEKSDDPGEQEDLVCRKILDIAIFMARLEKSYLHVVHSWFLPGETLLTSGRIGFDKDKLNRMRKMTEKIHTLKIKNLMKNYNLSEISHSIVVINGDPGKVIVEYTQKNKIDLIVMGTIGRSGLAGILIGSTAEKIINKVNCSVLTIKPDNFKSPIKIK